MEKIKTPIRRTLNLAASLATRNDNRIPVHWRLDKADRQGILYVAVPDAINDKRVVAELCALNYLMTCPRPAFGGPRAPASSTTTVTSGAIKKALRQDTEKGEIIPFARFLFHSFLQGELDVEKDTSWTQALPVVEEMRIEATPSRWPSLPCAVLRGEVGISRHAVERYMERAGTSNALNTFASFRRMLGDSRTVELSVEEKKRDSGLLRYGKTARFLLHKPSEAIFVVVPEEGGFVVATIYYQSEPLKEAVYVRGRIEIRNR